MVEDYFAIFQHFLVNCTWFSGLLAHHLLFLIVSFCLTRYICGAFSCLDTVLLYRINFTMLPSVFFFYCNFTYFVLYIKVLIFKEKLFFDGYIFIICTKHRLFYCETKVLFCREFRYFVCVVLL